MEKSMENLKQKKKVSYDDILASLKMSMNSSGKLEIVRTDAAASTETKLKDQITQKYVKPVKPNNNKNQQHQNQPNQQNQQNSNNQKQQIQQQIRSHYNKPVTRVPIKPMPPTSIINPKQNYLNSYYSQETEKKEIKVNKEIKKENKKEEIKEEINEEIKLTIIEDNEITEEEKQAQQEYNKEQYRRQQEYNKSVLLHRIQQHNERVWINQTKSKKLLFSSSNIQISPIPINNLFGLK